MFMAAAPEGQVELDFERRRRRSSRRHAAAGSRDRRGDRGAGVSSRTTGLGRGSVRGGASVVSWRHRREPGPVLLLETAEGGADRVGPGDLVRALGADPPPLVVLSACRTAEIGREAAAPGGVGRRDGDRRKRMCCGTGARHARAGDRRLVCPPAGDAGSPMWWAGTARSTTRTRPTSRRPSIANWARSSVPRAAAMARRTLLRKKEQRPQARAALASGSGLSRAQGRRARCAAGQAEGGVRSASGRSSTRPGSVFRWRRGRSSSAGGARSSRCCARSARRRGAGSRHGGARQVEPGRAGAQPDAAPSAGSDL